MARCDSCDNEATKKTKCGHDFCNSCYAIYTLTQKMEKIVNAIRTISEKSGIAIDLECDL